MIAANPLSPPFQALLNGLGAALAFLYNLIPNYGVAIILLTLAIRVLLLPLGIKQIRSMQAMQAIQPKAKALQAKYKGNRQKLNEELMALYKEHNYNPLSGCLPLLAQFPVLIALFAVLRVPGGLTHIPDDSRLHAAIIRQDTHFLGSNLLCSATQAGKTVTIPTSTTGAEDIHQLDCGRGIPVRIPYYVFAGLMIGTTFYQQRQMQKASPPGAAQQQQALTRVMPLVFGVWGFFFPAGLVVYWVTTNVAQIGQQWFLINRGGLGQPIPDAAQTSKPTGAAAQKLRGEQRPGGRGASGGKPAPRGSNSRPRAAASPAGTRAPKLPTSPKRTGTTSKGAKSGSSASGGNGSSAPGGSDAASSDGSGSGTTGAKGSTSKGTSGGRGGGDRKKRRKR